MLLLGFVLLPVPVVLFFFLWVDFFFLGVVWSVDVLPLVSAPIELDWPLDWLMLLPYPPEELGGFWLELPVCAAAMPTANRLAVAIASNFFFIGYLPSVALGTALRHDHFPLHLRASSLAAAIRSIIPVVTWLRASTL